MRAITPPLPMLIVYNISLPPRPLRNGVRRAQAVVQAPINQPHRTKTTEPAEASPSPLARFVRSRGTTPCFHYCDGHDLEVQIPAYRTPGFASAENLEGDRVAVPGPTRLGVVDS